MNCFKNVVDEYVFVVGIRGIWFLKLFVFWKRVEIWKKFKSMVGGG